MWTAKKLAEKYLEFFKEKGHAIIPSASLIPENDPTVLFTTAGMHPLVPYLLGQSHPLGKRIANNQKCIRTGDIDEIGDPSHLTFFFMLGNWSLGDYFKKEAIEWSYEFLTSRKWLGLDKKKLHITCFAGDRNAPKDLESARVWESLGIPKERIFFNPKKGNWWGPAGKTGPCGPDTEMFYDTGKKKCGKKCRPGCSCGKYFEIWNDVFMQYNKKQNGSYEQLKQRNVDTGMGVERTVAMLQGKETVYETEMFAPAMKTIEALAEKDSCKSARIIADHLRAAVFILAEGPAVAPSNAEQGYVIRRLIRRAIRHGRLLGIKEKFCRKIAEIFVEIYGSEWPELRKNREHVFLELDREEDRFLKVVGNGTRAFERMVKKSRIVSGKDAFLLFQSFGFPLEMTLELAAERNLKVNKKDFEKEFKKHQELSRKATEGKFKSGLADKCGETVKLHTATHLLHSALRKVLGKHVQQKGSNITAERLRFDFSHTEKLSKEQLKKVEKLVNEQIKKGVDVKREEMPLDEAKKADSLAFFAGKYAKEKVSVYSLGDFSREVCAGPHVKNTRELGKFRILKEEAVAVGIRRIKAVLETK